MSKRLNVYSLRSPFMFMIMNEYGRLRLSSLWGQKGSALRQGLQLFIAANQEAVFISAVPLVAHRREIQSILGMCLIRSSGPEWSGCLVERLCTGFFCLGRTNEHIVKYIVYVFNKRYAFLLFKLGLKVRVTFYTLLEKTSVLQLSLREEPWT